MSVLDDEWNSALDEEYGDAEETTEEVAEEAPDEADTADTGESEEDAGEAREDEPEEDEQPVEEAADEEDADAGADEEGESKPDEEEAPETPANQEEETPATREEIKAALREIEKENSSRESGLNTMKEEVLNTLYPEGIDRQLRDADGDPIKGIEDLTGIDPQTGQQVGAGLINPVTGDVFTEEEAARYILRGQQRLNEQVQLMEDQAYRIAETQLSLKESSDRVEAEFGPVLDSLPPEISKQITEAYIRTLRRDKETGMVVDVPLDAYEFYSIALAGMKPLAQGQAPPTQAPQAQNIEPPARRSDKGDRADLDQRGTPTKLSQEDREWEEAFNEILN